MKSTALTVIASTIAFSSIIAAPAFANSKLDAAIEKAVVRHKETDKITAYSHDFHIKPVTATSLGGLSGYKITGQLSHRLRFRTDDQYYYTVTIDRAGTILKMDEKIDRGGLTAMALKLHAGDIVEKVTGGKIPSAVANEAISQAGHWLGGKLDGSWEGAARKVVIQVGLQVAKTYNLTPTAYAKLAGKVDGATTGSNVRDHRMTSGRANVRDHRMTARPTVRDHRVNVRDHRVR